MSGFRSWHSTDAVLDGQGATTSYDFQHRLGTSVLFRSIPSQAFFWVFGIVSLFVTVRFSLQRYSKTYLKLEPRRRLNVLIYIVELIVSTCALIAMLYFGAEILGTDTSLRGSFADFRFDEIQYWGDDLAWTVVFDHASGLVGFAAVPMNLLYAVELVLWATSSQLQVELVLHHLFSIVMLYIITTASFRCLDLSAARFGIAFSLHGMCEQPIWSALLLHRYNAVRRLDLVLKATAIYTILLRVAIGGLTWYLYYIMCFTRPVVTDWIFFLRIIVPIILGPTFLVQLYIANIYWSIGTKHYNRISQPHSTVLPSPVKVASLATTKCMNEKNEEKVYASKSTIRITAQSKSESIIINEKNEDKQVSASRLSTDYQRPIASEEDIQRPSVRFIQYKNVKRRAKSTRSVMDSSTTDRRASITCDARRHTIITLNGDYAVKLGQLSERRNKLHSRESIPKTASIVCSILLLGFSMALISTLVLQDPLTCSIVEVPKGQKIAIIGGGVAGMAIAHQLATDTPHAITLLESKPRLGGNIKPYCVGGECVDVAFKVFDSTYHNFFQLLESDLRVESRVGRLRFSVTVHEGDFQSNITAIGSSGLPEAAENLLSEMQQEIEKYDQLIAAAAEDYTEERFMTETLGTFLQMHNFSERFASLYLRPCQQTYIASGITYLESPIALVHFFEEQFGVCKSFGEIVGRTFPNSSLAYLESWEQRLKAHSTLSIRTGETIIGVQPRDSAQGNARLYFADGRIEEFDQVVVATNLAATRKIMQKSEMHREIFRHIKSVNTSFRVHQESSVTEKPLLFNNCSHAEMYNVHIPNNGISGGTVFNAIQRRDTLGCSDPEQLSTIIFEDSDTEELPDTFLTSLPLGSGSIQHIPHTTDFFIMGRNLHKFQGRGAVWFAGAELMMNLHEFGYVSGLVIAQQLGARYPHSQYSNAGQAFTTIKGWLMLGINAFSSANRQLREDT
mmetsp:Transcript_14429/g.24225  ORF Transcript_14429/g.24225 Transcript_14429/m.24225 type:complete len:963 (-) Transcript_14429:221-3109(-)